MGCSELVQIRGDDMPGIVGNFEDCPVIICDNNNCIAEAIIKEHDRINSTIEISKTLSDYEHGYRLSVLILHPGGTVEFSGTLRKLQGSGREIALFNERHRGARGAPRHKLNSPATIRSLVLENGRQPFAPPLKVVIHDISKTGVLIKSPPGHFDIGSVLELHFNIHGKDAILYATVVRKCDGDDDATIGFGCKLLFLS